MGNSNRIAFERAGFGTRIRIVVDEEGKRPTVEFHTGLDGLGVERWERRPGYQSELLCALESLADALVGEQGNCSRLAQQHHSAVQRSVELANRVNRLEGILRECLGRDEIKSVEQRGEILYALGDPDDLECPEDDEAEIPEPTPEAQAEAFLSKPAFEVES